MSTPSISITTTIMAMTTVATGSVPSTECTKTTAAAVAAVAMVSTTGTIVWMTSTRPTEPTRSPSSSHSCNILTMSNSRRPTVRATTRTIRTAWHTTSSGHMSNR